MYEHSHFTGRCRHRLQTIPGWRALRRQYAGLSEAAWAERRRALEGMLSPRGDDDHVVTICEAEVVCLVDNGAPDHPREVRSYTDPVVGRCRRLEG